MPARAPSLLVTAESPLCVGLRVRRWRSRSAGQMRPHIPRRRRGLHRTTGATLSYSVVGALCPRRCPLSYLGSPTGPFLGRGCVVRSFFGTTARSARLAPTDRLRLIAYTVRPAVRGCSRRGTSPSQLCVMPLAPVPLSIRRRDSSTALARLFAEGNSLRLGERGSALSGPQHPLLLRGGFRRGNIRFMLRPERSFASLVGPTLSGSGGSILGAFTGAVALPRRPIPYARERAVPRGRTLTGWRITVTGCEPPSPLKFRTSGFPQYGFE